MPRSYEDIIREILESRPELLHKPPDEDDDIRTLMQDPSQMQNTMGGGAHPHPDMRTNPQTYATMHPPAKPPVSLDTIYDYEKYDDTQTYDQNNRNNQQGNDEIYRQPRTPEINPDAPPADPHGSYLDELFTGYSKSDPNVSNMQKLYRQMPMQKPTGSDMQVLTPDGYQTYNVPKQYEQPQLDTMQQLQQFFMGGSEI